MYISFKGKVYRFREEVREGAERGMGEAERRIGQDKRGEWNGTERGMAAVICRCNFFTLYHLAVVICSVLRILNKWEISFT